MSADTASSGTLADLTDPAGRRQVAGALRAWLPRQRWFAGKARELRDVSVVDTLLLGDGDSQVLDVLADVTFSDGHAERYQVPLASGSVSDAGSAGGLTGVDAVDATGLPATAATLAAAMARPARRSAEGAQLTGVRLDDEPLDLSDGQRLTGEQSNTSIRFGRRHILKVFRKLEPGENPDVELTAALTSAGFPYSPRQRGALHLRAGGDATTLAVLADFVDGGRDGWELATADVGAWVATGGSSEGGWLIERFADLGRAVAEMHAALLASLGGRRAAPADTRIWTQQMRQQAEQVLATAAHRAADATHPVLRRGDRLLEALGGLAGDADACQLTRTHGDLHLGQVLLDADDRWQLLDFEGEPARPLRERREVSAPLRDVAGMLRSFDYAAAAGSGGDLSAVPQAAADWRNRARERFLGAYLPQASQRGLLPASGTAVRGQLAAFELDKAVYELRYELANRPDWVPIPVGGIVRVLDGSMGTAGGG